MSDDLPPVSWTCPRCGGIEFEAIALLVGDETPIPGEANVECTFHYPQPKPPRRRRLWRTSRK